MVVIRYKTHIKKLFIFILILGSVQNQIISRPFIRGGNPSIANGKAIVTAKNTLSPSTFKVNNYSPPEIYAANIQNDILQRFKDQLPKNASLNSTKAKSTTKSLNQQTKQPPKDPIKPYTSKMTLYQLAYELKFDNNLLAYYPTKVEVKPNVQTVKNVLMKNQQQQSFNNQMSSMAQKLSNQLLDNKPVNNLPVKQKTAVSQSYSQKIPTNQAKNNILNNYDQTVINIKQQIQNKFDHVF